MAQEQDPPETYELAAPRRAAFSPVPRGARASGATLNEAHVPFLLAGAYALQ
jgi:hypothetical protein